MYIHKCITLSIVHDQLLVFNLQQGSHGHTSRQHSRSLQTLYYEIFFGDGRATVEVR